MTTTLNNETARRKMIFLALLSGAVAYRKEFITEEVEENRVLCEEMGNSVLSDPKKKINTKGKEKKVKRIASNTHYTYLNRVRKFDEAATKEIDTLSQEFKIPTDGSFQGYVNGFGAIIGHYVDAKDTGDLLAVCQAYNAGLLDEVLTLIKAQQVEEKKDFFEKVESLEKHNVGELIDIASAPVKLSVVKGDDKPYSEF